MGQHVVKAFYWNNTYKMPFTIIDNKNEHCCKHVWQSNTSHAYVYMSKMFKDLNIFMESKIKEHPEEYLWQHRRFKSTLGKENFYA